MLLLLVRENQWVHLLPLSRTLFLTAYPYRYNVNKPGPCPDYSVRLSGDRDRVRENPFLGVLFHFIPFLFMVGCLSLVHSIHQRQHVHRHVTDSSSSMPAIAFREAAPMPWASSHETDIPLRGTDSTGRPLLIWPCRKICVMWLSLIKKNTECTPASNTHALSFSIILISHPSGSQ
jgi:hypothetical protein